MTQFKCMIVDDEPMAISVIKSHIDKLDYLSLDASCRNAIDALNILKTKTIDILFIDIQMPQFTGIDLIKMLDQTPKIILITAYKEFALDGYELDVVDYLLKPVAFDRFVKAVDKAIGRIEKPPQIEMNDASSKSPYLLVKSDKQMKKVYLSDIIFIEGLKDYIRIITRVEKIVSYLSLKYMIAKLPESTFLRVHRSYIINCDHINAYNSTEIILFKHKVPIGRYYKKTVQDFLNQNEN